MITPLSVGSISCRMSQCVKAWQGSWIGEEIGTNAKSNNIMSYCSWFSNSTGLLSSIAISQSQGRQLTFGFATKISALTIMAIKRNVFRAG